MGRVDFKTRTASFLILSLRVARTEFKFFKSGEPAPSSGVSTHIKKILFLHPVKYDVVNLSLFLRIFFSISLLRSGSKKGAFELYDIEPDFIVLSKQITSSYIPMATDQDSLIPQNQ